MESSSSTDIARRVIDFAKSQTENSGMRVTDALEIAKVVYLADLRIEMYEAQKAEGESLTASTRRDQSSSAPEVASPQPLSSLSS